MASPAASAAEGGAALPSTFASLGLAEVLCEACAALGYKTPTDIQRTSIPHALAGAQRVPPSWQPGRLPVRVTVARVWCGVFSDQAGTLLVWRRRARGRRRPLPSLCSTAFCSALRTRRGGRGRGMGCVWSVPAGSVTGCLSLLPLA
jgi:hypothetical protein